MAHRSPSLTAAEPLQPADHAPPERLTIWVSRIGRSCLVCAVAGASDPPASEEGTGAGGSGAPPPPGPPSISAPSSRIPRSGNANLAIVLIALGLLATAAGIAVNFLSARSRDAVINAVPIHVSAPIEGVVERIDVQPGSLVQAGAVIARVRNPVAPRDAIKTLQTALQTATSRVTDLEEQEGLQQQRLTRLRSDREQQLALESERDRQEIRETEAALQRTGQALAFARRDAERQRFLFEQGAVAGNVVDRAYTEVEQRQHELDGLRSRRAAQNAVLRASEGNLSLRHNRSGFDPSVRLQEEELALNRLQGDLRTERRRVSGLREQLAVAEQEWSERHEWTVRSPRTAVVWDVLAQEGDRVNGLEPLLTLIDCERRWLTTTMTEHDLNEIGVGSKARVQLVGNRRRLRGEVVSIRSGIGRLQLGEEAIRPVPINLARESEVRVRLLNDWPAPPEEFCYVGSSARVVFGS
ncbi:HlyD family efflux transporter periplasmic adaptor subunit [Synechococcus sp. RSCCF101]|uniref:HlyD family secretion protein n=1 Tax=Synechococcus sp. RSCCF101 TaxID=2511069 RepID=UPI0012446177|nr:HlyD family efflux transporter periplasmic adaptor subunit [Synechococcus sp. RSCCF101]QEY32462.1 HlyD family efflux transporter periplasmic adaptor subunit [Synechococcus sp. RSCCF101]